MSGWFPPSWRRRYGAELEALVADMAAAGAAGGRGSARRWRIGLDIARAGLAERWRSAPGTALVLWGWACFVAGGTAFAKWAEHFHRYTLAVASYQAVVVGAACGAVAVVSVALALVPAVRTWGLGRAWRVLRRRSVLAGVMTLAWTGMVAGLSSWAHHLSAAARNGADGWYGLAFVCVGAAGVATLFVWTSLATGVVAGTSPMAGTTSSWVLRLASRLLAFLMLVMAIACVAWAVSTGQPLGPAPAFVALSMAAGLGLALAGAGRLGSSGRLGTS